MEVAVVVVVVAAEGMGGTGETEVVRWDVAAGAEDDLSTTGGAAAGGA